MFLLLALAAGVRFYGLRFGMPHVWARPDELGVVDIGQGFLRGDLNPRFWSYPTLFMYVLGALDYGYYLFGRAAGWFQSRDHFLSLWKIDWTPFFMIARVVSAVAGTATVALAYRIGARLFDRLTGGIAALFLALAFLHVRDSHFGTTDVTMTFFLVLAFGLLVRGVTENSTRAFALAGAAAGAGASVKYNVVIMFAALAAALIVTGAGTGATTAARRAALFAACFVACFFAGSPYAAIDYREFVAGVLRESAHVGTPHGVDLGPGGIYHLAFSLRYGLGLPMLAAGIGGLLWTFRLSWRTGLLLASFPLAYYAVIAPTRTVFVRYAIPLVPFLCLGAAVATTAAASSVARALGGHRAPWLAWAIALVLVAPPAYAVSRIDRLFAGRDNRLLVADWLRVHVPQGSSVYISGNIVVQPIVDLVPGRRTLRYWTHRGGTSFAEDRAPVEGTPDWLVIAETGVPQFSFCPPEVKALAAQRYNVAGVFTAVDLERNKFDRQDAFYYPYAGFQGAARGGPNYVVYSRKN